jgi:eukaryotic-like serine/threonine-protein kinase
VEVRRERLTVLSWRSMAAPEILGRYVLYDQIASGGMASVYLARLTGVAGFSRTVAIKRLHAHLAHEPEFVAMFLDEARLVANIRHPNVVPTLDVVAHEGELLLVMEYVQGASLAALLRVALHKKATVPPGIVSAIVCNTLLGLHAAHTARDGQGEELRIVHRDVSPQNVLIGEDGVARVLDFGIAKAIGRLQTTRDGQLKGKCSYMAPEQLRGKDVDARTDIHAAAVVLWESVTKRRLFTGDTPEETMMQVLERKVPLLSATVPGVPKALDDVVAKGLARVPTERWSNAREMAIALETAVSPASSREVADWVKTLLGEELDARAARVRRIESEAALEVPTRVDRVSTVGMSVVTPLESRVRLSRRATGAVAVALLTVAGVAIAVAKSWTPTPTSQSAKPVAASISLSDSPDAAPSPTPPETSTESSSSASPISPPSTSSSTVSPARRVPSSRPHPTVKKPNCNPPYVVNEQGFRDPKPECF